jgi:hypothetical protein
MRKIASIRAVGGAFDFRAHTQPLDAGAADTTGAVQELIVMPEKFPAVRG